MKAPPLLLGASLLLWGWEAGLFWISALAALALEAPHLLNARWTFSQADLDRIWNLCVALFLGATIYAFVSADSLNAIGDLVRNNSPGSRLATLNQSKRSLFQLLQWLPLMFLPIALAQAFGEADRMDLSTFSWWLRRKRRPDGLSAGDASLSFNVSYPFFGCCLFGASAGNERSWWFAAGLVTLVGWALWTQRPRSYRWSSWAATLIVTLGLGVALQFGLLEFQKLIQRIDEALAAQWGGTRGFDATESQTRIGAIGRLKLSGRILLRVETDGQGPPSLLRQAAYDVFRAPYWTCSTHEFEEVMPETNQTSWILRPMSGPGRRVTIAGYLQGGKGLLAAPQGLAQLGNLPALNLTTNVFGTVRAEDGPGFVQFDADYESAHSIGSPPQPDDWQIPPHECAAVSDIAVALHLGQRSPREIVHTVEKFFAEHFTYSLWQDERHQANDRQTALARFLLEHRSGHCEYFATATVLLLRAADIPARYATGYVVQERKGHYYVVRERHAHAWCQAWLDGAWRDVDTTPGTWLATENSRASAWEPIGDFFSRAWFEFSRWRWGHTEWKRYSLWLIVPVLAFVLGKLFLEKQWRRQHSLGSTGSGTGRPGADSEFYLIERKLAKAGLAREPGETGSAWLGRVTKSGAVPSEELPDLLAIHYRLRFDPHGLGPSERMEFKAEVKDWLDRTVTDRAYRRRH